MANNQLWIILIVILVVGVLVYICSKKKSKFTQGNIEDLEKESKVENFVAAGALDNSGALLGSQYDLIQSPDAEIAASDFADLVSEGADNLLRQAKQPENNGENFRPMERLSRIQGSSLMPRVSNMVTPYNVDLGNPKSFKYSVNFPRIQLKPKLWESGLYQSTRGSIPIKYFANVPVVSISQYGRDNQRFDAMFSPGGIALYNKYTGSGYKSLPILTAGGGQASGMNGASGETIMDHYE